MQPQHFLGNVWTSTLAKDMTWDFSLLLIFFLLFFPLFLKLFRSSLSPTAFLFWSVMAAWNLPAAFCSVSPLFHPPSLSFYICGLCPWSWSYFWSLHLSGLLSVYGLWNQNQIKTGVCSSSTVVPRSITHTHTHRLALGEVMLELRTAGFLPDDDSPPSQTLQSVFVPALKTEQSSSPVIVFMTSKHEGSRAVRVEATRVFWEPAQHWSV